MKETVTTKKTNAQLIACAFPGFITDEEVGLGDAVKRMTYAVGIMPCGDCEQRAKTLNRWLTFSGRRGK